MIADQQKCSRIINLDKYERQSPETFNWWCKLLRIMETDFAVPSYKRSEVICKIFPKRILAKIISIITMVDSDIREQTSPFTICSAKSINYNKLRVSNGRKTSFSQFRSCIASSMSTPSVKSQQSQSTDKKQKEITVVDRKRREAGPNNPYVRFFKRNPERAAIWRDLPPLSLEEMTLAQKAEAITQAIATDFVSWIKNLSGEQQSTLDVPQVVKLFEIGFNTHAATTLMCEVKEMPAVPKQMAEFRLQSRKTIPAKLQQKIKEDIKGFNKKKKVLAFQKTLPKEMRYVPPKEDVTKMWLLSKTHESLKDMSVVWNDITHLSSTRAFCKWLIENPEVPRPKYLDQVGMLTSDFL